VRTAADEPFAEPGALPFAGPGDAASEDPAVRSREGPLAAPFADRTVNGVWPAPGGAGADPLGPDAGAAG
jgi:hypothetical protein